MPVHVRDLSNEHPCVDLFREGKFSQTTAPVNMDYACASHSTMTLLSSKQSQLRSTQNFKNGYFGNNSPSFASSVKGYHKKEPIDIN